MELYVYDKGLNLQGILESFFSLIWTRRYNKAGGFELHCSLTPETLNLLQKGWIVFKKDDREAGYIKYRRLAQDNKGNEVFIVKGDFLTGYLGRRIVWGMETLDTTAELAIRELIDKHAIGPVDPNRAIPLLELGQVKGFPGTITMQTSYANLLDGISDIANTNGLGFCTLADVENKKLVFDIYQGVDRTARQNENPPVIFSREFENVLSQEFIDSLDNYRNVVLVAGEGEGEERKRMTVGEGEGLDRYELYVDARDLQSENENGQTIPPEEYEKMLINRGETKLAEHKKIETFGSKINLRSNLLYKKDFDLGDVVTVISKKWGVTVDTRITEIEEVYEPGGQEIYCTFGNAIPTLTDKIKQVVG